MSEPADTLARAERALEQRQLACALSLFDRADAEGCNPDRCAGGRWMAAMLSGNFTAAWRESDAIRHRGAPDPHRFWQGEDLRGKRILVRCLHGLGDSIQFLRYAPCLKTEAACLVVECAPRAVELIRCLPGIDEVISWGSDSAATTDWDVQMEVMELPYIFRSTLPDLPIAIKYLRLPEAEMRAAARSLDISTTAFRIGIVWSAGEWNRSRALPIQLFKLIVSHGKCQFWNLQGGAVRDEWQTLGSGPHLRDASVLANGGLVPLAAIIAQLDLVITVDTLAAHLAGALGVDCFLLLQHAADWRWMVDRYDSPWYPSLRLFRQPNAGDWPAVIWNVHQAFTEWLSEPMRGRSIA